MSGDQTPEQADTLDTTQEAPTAETKSGKKSKAEKKKAAASLHVEEETPAPAPVDVAVVEPAVSAPTDRPTAAPAASGGVAYDLFQQGVQALLRAEYDTADNFFGQALTTYRKQGDKAGQVDVLEQLGHVCFLRGAVAQAEDYYRQASTMRAS